MDLFERAGTFGDDYLYFYGPMFSAERNEADTQRVVEALGLEPGERVLDAPCGHGRMSNLLAERGMEVTGLDATPAFLDIARRDAEARGVQVAYHVGDLRDLGTVETFDAAICWFTSFGYFDDEGNRAVLSQFADHLRPGGRLGIEMLHHDGFVRSFTAPPFSAPLYRGNDVMIDSARFDPVTGRVITERIIYRDREIRRTEHQIRLPTIPEFDVWLADAGFSKRSFHGPDGDPPTVDDMRLIVVAAR